MERAEDSPDTVPASSRQAGSVVSLDQALATALEAIGLAFKAVAVTLRLIEPGGLRVRNTWHIGSFLPAERGGISESHDDGAWQCATEGVPVHAHAPDGFPNDHLPLRAHNRAIGVLTVTGSNGVTVAEDTRLLDALAGLIAAAIESDMALGRETAARTRLEALNTLGRVINSSLDIRDVFDTFATETQLLLRHDRLSAHVLAANGLVDELFAAAGDHTLSAFSPGERRPVASSLPARVALEDRPFLAVDLPSDPRIIGIEHLMVPRNARSWLSVPLRANGQAFGALNFSSRAPASYTEADIPLAQQIADQLATYLDLVRLHRQERDLAVVEERTRLAREIHDSLSQDLSLLVLQLQALERSAGLPATTGTEIHAATEQARLALESARRSLWDLTPSPLEGRDLANALEEEIDRFCEATGLRGRMTVLGDARPLDTAREVAIFRITQEALANARKHAQARRIGLRLRYETEAVILTIEDDGRGFDTAAKAFASASGGFGLASMRERARLLDGTLELDSAPSRGTRVTARLPYAYSRSELGHALVSPMRAPAGDAGAGMRGRIRVLIADDHAVARHGIRRMLEAQPDIVVVGEAVDGQEAVEQAAEQELDVMLLDLQMPRLDGLAALRQVRAVRPDLGVIILTTYAQDERVFAALSDGARGYVLKDTSPEDLAEAVRVVAAGGSRLQGVVATRLVGRLQQRAVLTARELEVLRLADEGLRNKEIAIRLVVSERTVSFHLNNAYRKLDASGRTEALRVARTRGLLPA